MARIGVDRSKIARAPSSLVFASDPRHLRFAWSFRHSSFELHHSAQRVGLGFARRVAEEYQEDDKDSARTESGCHPNCAPVVLNRAGHISESVQSEDPAGVLSIIAAAAIECRMSRDEGSQIAGFEVCLRDGAESVE